MPKSKSKTPLQFHNKTEILVHYYPGNNSAPTQSTRYIAKEDEIRLPTGERAKTTKTGIPLFESRHFYFPSMEEIEINKGNHFFAKMLHWFKSIPSFIKHWWSGIKVVDGDKSSNNNNSYNGFVVNTNKSSLGQQTDIQEFAKSNEKIAQSPELSQKPRIYFGVSRGAAATFSALADVKIFQNIKLCVLEAPPSSLSGVFKYYGERYFNSRALGKWIYKTFHTLFLGKQHKTDKALQARGHVDKFPNTIPLLIISSKKDTTVPHENTIRLALRVAEKRSQAIKNGENGVAPVYFLQLEEVNHEDYATSGKQDSLRYRNTFHAVCRKHGLPYITEYADKGENEMHMASLLTLEYSPLIELQSSFWKTKESTVRNQCRTKANLYLANLKSSHNSQNIDRVQNIMHFSPLFSKKITPCLPVAINQNNEPKLF